MLYSLEIELKSLLSVNESISIYPPSNDKVILDYAGAVAGTTLLSQKVVKQTIPSHTTYSHVQVYAIKTIVNRMHLSYEHKSFSWIQILDKLGKKFFFM